MEAPNKVAATYQGNKPHGLIVANCRYDYDDIIKILKDKKYKTLILQFMAFNIDHQPLFSLLSYASDGSDYVKQELKPITGVMDVSQDKMAIMGNNVLVLDKLRDQA